MHNIGPGDADSTAVALELTQLGPTTQNISQPNDRFRGLGLSGWLLPSGGYAKGAYGKKRTRVLYMSTLSNSGIFILLCDQS